MARETRPAAPLTDAPLQYTPRKRHVVKEVLALAVFMCILGSVTLFYHYRLPAPQGPTTLAAPKPSGPISAAWYSDFFAHKVDSEYAEAFAPATGCAEDAPLHTYFSEANAMMAMQHLSEDIGYRVVGTQQHIDGEAWVESVLRRFEGVHETGSDHVTQVEVFRQEADGRHRFEILGHPVWKQYYGMSNLIVRISDGTDASKENTLLVNAHIDSTIPSPGAADDAAGVAIMLEALRILTLRGAPRLRHGVVLLFNNGEESLQDASHLYMTQDNTTSPSVRAVVNLEGCGVTGPSLLFQATDPALIRAYAKVPHPFTTVVASDVFSSGIIMSDTDFRQFQEYGDGLPGLDMAIVGSSYLYHTRRDIPAYVQRGVVQHLGENTLSLIQSLCVDASSPLPTITRWPYAQKRVLPVYFSLLGTFFVISPQLFKNIITSLAMLVNFMLSAMKTTETRIKFMPLAMLSTLGVILSLVAAGLAANVVAAVLRALNAPLSWFRHELFALVVYVPPALAAIIAVQLWLRTWTEQTRRPYLEYTSFAGGTIVYTFLALVMNFYALGSAYVAVMATLSFFVPMIVNDYFLLGLKKIGEGVAPDSRVHFFSYFLHLISPCTAGVEAIVMFLDLLVPLMGRMGTQVPVDHVISTLVAVLVAVIGGFVPPLCHRYGPKFMRKALWTLVGISCVSTAFFAAHGTALFDDTHPRRLLVHHVENITSGEWHLAYTGLDSAPRNKALDSAIERTVLGSAFNASLSWDGPMSAPAPDMDVLFPLTHFIDVTRVTLPETAERQALSYDAARWADVRVSCDELGYDAANGTRRVRMRLVHPGLAWSTLSFDADIVDWAFSAPPPEGMRRHHLKDVSRFGKDVFEIELTMRVDAMPEGLLHDTLRRSPPAHAPTPLPHGRLQVHFSGIDAFGMYPHQKSVGMDRLSMQTLEALDNVFTRDFPELDPMLISIVGGVGMC